MATTLEKINKVVVYNIVLFIVLVTTIELSTRTISMLSGKGFFLGLEELEAWDEKINSIYRWHPFTGFTFEKNTRFTGGHSNLKERSQVYTDEHGFLTNGKPLQIKKELGEVRIATIGASTTANIGLNYEDNWPGHLGNLIQAKHPDKKITIINAGIPGFTSAQSIGNLALRVMAFSPDIVIIYHAYNDLKAIRYDKAFQPDYTHLHDKPYGFHKPPSLITRALHKSMLYVRLKNKKRAFEEEQRRNEMLSFNHRNITNIDALDHDNRLDAIPDIALETFHNNMKALVSIARSKGSQVILSTFATLHDPTLDYRKTEVITQLTELKGKELMFLLQFTPGLKLNTIFSGIKQYNNIISSIAEQDQCAIVDNASLIGHQDSYFVDRVHFSAEGAKKMAESFFPAVEELLSNN